MDKIIESVCSNIEHIDPFMGSLGLFFIETYNE